MRVRRLVVQTARTFLVTLHVICCAFLLRRLTCGQQVQSRFQTAPTPVFGSSQRPPLNGEGCVVRQEHVEGGESVGERERGRERERERGKRGGGGSEAGNEASHKRHEKHHERDQELSFCCALSHGNQPPRAPISPHHHSRRFALLRSRLSPSGNCFGAKEPRPDDGRGQRQRPTARPEVLHGGCTVAEREDSGRKIPGARHDVVVLALFLLLS